MRSPLSVFLLAASACSPQTVLPYHPADDTAGAQSQTETETEPADASVETRDEAPPTIEVAGYLYADGSQYGHERERFTADPYGWGSRYQETAPAVDWMAMQLVGEEVCLTQRGADSGRDSQVGAASLSFLADGGADLVFEGEGNYYYWYGPSRDESVLVPGTTYTFGDAAFTVRAFDLAPDALLAALAAASETGALALTWTPTGGAWLQLYLSDDRTGERLVCLVHDDGAATVAMANLATGHPMYVEVGPAYATVAQYEGQPWMIGLHNGLTWDGVPADL